MSHLQLKNGTRKHASRDSIHPAPDQPCAKSSPSPATQQKESSYVNVTMSQAPCPNEETTKLLSITDSERSPSRALSSSIDSLQGKTEENDRYNRLKLKPGSGVLGNRTRRIHHRANRTDSESSSASGVSDNFEAKARETDHYNRLKLNLNQVPQNKKALKGLRILYKDPPARLQHLQPASRSQLHSKRKQKGGESGPPSATTTQVIKRTESKSQAKYRNESHTNKIHAVSEKPKRSPSFNWSMGPAMRSHSMGDMAKISESTDGPGKQDLESSSSGRTRRPLATRSHSFSEVHSTRASNRSSKYSNKDSPIHTVEDTTDPYVSFHPVSSKTRRRRSDVSDRRRSQHRRSGECGGNKRGTERWSLGSKSDSHVDMLTHSTEYHPTPTDTYSPTHSRLSKCNHEACSTVCMCKGVPFVEPVASITCDSEGREYRSEEHDFKIYVPKGAIKKRAHVEIQVGITFQRSFDFPEGKRPVSPILWLCSNPETKFKRPVEVTLPHYLDASVTDLANESGKTGTAYGLSFLKASHKSSVVSVRGRRRYQFEPTDGEEWFWSNENHGTLHTKHFCFLCIAANVSSDVTTKAIYCLVPVIPKPIEQPTWKLHYCVTYMLKTCIQMVQRQYGENVEILSPRKFKFAGGGKEAKIEIQFQRSIPNGGWVLALESVNKIHASDVDFWAHEETELEVMESTQVRPPCFTVRVHGEDATAAAVAHVSFVGVAEELSTEVVLPVRAKNRGSRAEDNAVVLSPLLHHSGSRHCGTCVCCDSDDSGDYDHLPSLEELGRTHAQLTYHNGRIDIPTDEDLHEVAKEVMVRMREEWPLLQGHLDIPDHIMLDVLHQRTIRQQVFRMLKEWRGHSQDCSKAKLAECLRNADQRLSVAADVLTSGKSLCIDQKTSPTNEGPS